MNNKDRLYKTYENLIKIKGECSCELVDKFNMSELTISQVEYIKKLDQYECVTTSELAETLNLSKPSVSEMIKKFIKLDCVYKMQCNQDGRVQYIHLTEKGKCIARFEEIKIKSMIDKIVENLEDEEIEILIQLLSKVE